MCFNPMIIGITSTDSKFHDLRNCSRKFLLFCVAAAQVITGQNGEIDDSFDFNKWIQQHKLIEIKDKLIEHGLISKRTITTTSYEFKAFISDPEILSSKGHILPQLFSAIAAIPNDDKKYIYAIYFHFIPL